MANYLKILRTSSFVENSFFLSVFFFIKIELLFNIDSIIENKLKNIYIFL